MFRTVISFASLFLVAPALAAEEARTFTFRYATTVEPVEAGEGPVHIWIPLAVENRAQRCGPGIGEGNPPDQLR